MELDLEEWNEEKHKTEELESLVRDLTALRAISLDLEEMVEGQGQDIEKIEEHQDNTVKETLETGKILKEAAVIQSKGWKSKLGIKLGAIGAAIGLVVGPVGAAIGGSIGAIGGAVIGKKLEKKQKKNLDSIKF